MPRNRISVLQGHYVHCTPSHAFYFSFPLVLSNVSKTSFKLAISQRASRGQLSHPGPGCQDKQSQWLKEESPWDEAIDLG